MDTRSAEKQVREVVEYVQSLQSADNKLYSKSKDRLKAVAQSCEEIISIVSKILQQEILSAESDGYEIQNVVDSIQEQAATLEYLSTSKRPYFSKAVKSQILDEYINTFAELLETRCKYSKVNILIKLIYDWLYTRFYVTGEKFIYKFDKVPQWVCDIIIGYCESVSNHTENSFVSNFYLWIDRLAADPTECKYAIPSMIYRISADGYKQHITLTALVIYDILEDVGLKQLGKSVKPELTKYNNMFLTPDSIYNIAESCNPKILDGYRQYQYDASILIKCNIAEEGSND